MRDHTRQLMEQAATICPGWHIAVFPAFYLNQYGEFSGDVTVILTSNEQQVQARGTDLADAMNAAVLKAKETEAMDALNVTCIE